MVALPREAAGSSALPRSPTIADTNTDPLIDYSVVHRILGRARLRVEQLRFNEDLAARIEGRLGRQPGVRHVRVSVAALSVIVEYESATVSITRIGMWLQEAPLEPPKRRLEERDRGDLAALMLGAAALALNVLRVNPLVSTALVAASALPIAGRALQAAGKERRLSADALDISAVTVLGMRGSIGAAALSSSLIAAGEYIRSLTARRSRMALADLISSTDSYAWLVDGDRRVRVRAEQLEPGQTIVVYPGELIPADGIVESGVGAADERTLTGESLPAQKAERSEVFASTHLVDGKLYIRTVRTGASSHAHRLIAALESAPAHETAAANHAARFADRLVLPTIGLATVTYLLTRNIARAVSILIFDFATGIRVSAPTTTLAAMTAAARRSVVVKSGSALEKLAGVDTVFFDKTGTLTSGTPEVTQVLSFDAERSGDEVLALAAAVEQRTSHPVAQAILAEAEARGLKIPTRTRSHYEIGYGMRAYVGGHRLRVGERPYMARKRIALGQRAEELLDEVSSRGESAVLVARDERPIGLVAFADTPRPEAASVIAGLRARGIGRIIMVTGDREQVARGVGAALGIDDVRAEVFPEQKAAIVEELQAAGHRVAVIGDGINDSPALAYADVSISIEGATDAARETADIVLHGGLTRLPECIDLARETVRLIREDMRIVAVPNAMGMVLATFGFVGPLASTALNNGSTIVAGMNSLRPLRAAALPAPQAPREAGPIAPQAALPAPREAAPIAPQAALPAPREAAPIAPETAPAGGTHDLAS